MAVKWALTQGVVGVGRADDERTTRRLERFAAAPIGAFVWTREPDGATYLGRITGEWRHDASGAPVDLADVRDCDWASEPVDPTLIPPAVRQTFARGGRNFQQIHPGDVETETSELWDRLGS